MLQAFHILDIVTVFSPGRTLYTLLSVWRLVVSGGGVLRFKQRRLSRTPARFPALVYHSEARVDLTLSLWGIMGKVVNWPAKNYDNLK